MTHSDKGVHFLQDCVIIEINAKSGVFGRNNDTHKKKTPLWNCNTQHTGMYFYRSLKWYYHKLHVYSVCVGPVALESHVNWLISEQRSTDLTLFKLEPDFSVVHDNSRRSFWILTSSHLVWIPPMKFACLVVTSNSNPIHQPSCKRSSVLTAGLLQYSGWATLLREMGKIR